MKHVLGLMLLTTISLNFISCAKGKLATIPTEKKVQQVENCTQLESPDGDTRKVCVVNDDGLNIIEGDIVLGEVKEAAQKISGRGGFTLSSLYRFQYWPQGIVPYKISTDLNGIKFANSEQLLADNISKAIKHYSDNTSIHFVPRTNEADYVTFSFRPNLTGSCVSDLGKQGGEQFIRLGLGCGTGNLIHEIGHTLGLFHEQTRADRDSYVKINYENIDPKSIRQFDKALSAGTAVGAYDYYSIMHYAVDTFIHPKYNTDALRAAHPTITPIGRSAEGIGQRRALSDGDMATIEKMYAKYRSNENVPQDLNLASAIQKLYQKILRRVAQTAEENSVKTSLASGKKPFAVAFGLLQSQEHLDNIIRHQYSSILSRFPTAAEQASWVVEFKANRTDQLKLMAALLATPENLRYVYRTDGMSFGQAFVSNLYTYFVGVRSSFANCAFVQWEYSFWRNLNDYGNNCTDVQTKLLRLSEELDSGAKTPTQISMEIAKSRDSLMRLVFRLYRKYQNQIPNDAQVSRALNLLDEGYGLFHLEAQIATQDSSYFDVSRLAVLGKIFKVLMGRDASAIELDAILGTSGDLSYKISRLLEFEEARRLLINNHYKALLNRVPTAIEFSAALASLALSSNLEEVIHTILTSNEFYTKNGSSNAQLVTAMLRDLMGVANPAVTHAQAIQDGVNELNQVTRSAFVVKVLNGNKYRLALIQQFTKSLLGRDATDIDYTNFTEGHRIALLVQILSSKEYQYLSRPAL